MHVLSAMVKKCCVPNCNSNYDSTDCYITVFKFPNDPKRLADWISKIPRADLVVNGNTRICEKHFDERFIRRTYLLKVSYFGSCL